MTLSAPIPVIAVLMGVGATLAFDLWGLSLKLAFKVRPSDICLVGRWLLHMPGGVFRHASIGAASHKSHECAVGWLAHYAIGVTFALGYVTLAGENWLRQPTLLPALGFGIATVLAPMLIMQPAMGLGFAASRAPNPLTARLRSLLNHAAFGVGLFLTAWLCSVAL